MGNYRKDNGVLITYLGTTTANVTDIEDDISALGPKCFEHLTALTSITIPDQIKEIRYGAFLGCTSLRTCTIQETSQLSAIDALAFYGCAALTSINLPISLKRSDHYAFMHSGIRRATIPSMTVSALFPTEYTKITNITIAKNSVVQPYTFAGCDNDVLSSISIPNEISTFMPKAFEGFSFSSSSSDGKTVINGKWIIGYPTSDLQSNISCGTNSEIGVIGEAFAFHPELEKLTIMSTLKTVGSRAFAGCQKLKEIIIESDSTYIADDAFEGCPKLSCVAATQNMLNNGLKNIYPRSYETIQKVKLASNVRRIPTQSFEGIANFNSIEFDDGQLSCIEVNAFNSSQIQSQLSNDHGLSCYKDWIFDGLNFSTPIATISGQYHGIAPGAFAGNSKIQSLNLSNVEYIGKQAFADCGKLQRLQINNKSLPDVQDMEGYPFGLEDKAFTMSYYYESEKYTTLINNINSIGSSTFSQKTKGIIVGSKCTSIEANACKNLSNLMTFDAGQNDLSIGSYAFFKLSTLVDLKASYNTVIDVSAFSGCNRLTSVIMFGRPYSDKANWGSINDANMTIVSYETDDSLPITMMKKFTGSSITLSSHTVDDEPVATDQLDFYYNGRLYTVKDAVEISLQPQIRIITDYAFKGCTKLKKLTIKASLTTSNPTNIRLGQWAFSTCYNLEQINFTKADTLLLVQNIRTPGSSTIRSYPWGYVGSITQNPIDIVVIG